MSKDSKIEWTHHTFNPWWGCVKVSPACDHCYAETFAKRVGFQIWGPGTDRRFFGDAYWRAPLSWNKAAAAAGTRARVFCASMADVFENRNDLVEPRASLFQLIDATPSLDWLLLTKRPHLIRKLTKGRDLPGNVWLGTTVENQEYAAKRVPYLLECEDAAVRFLSCEPMLGPIDLAPFQRADGPEIDWVIAGGESGHHSRPMHPLWSLRLQRQCAELGIAFHFKQWGDWAPASALTAPLPERGLRLTTSLEGQDEAVMFRVGKKQGGRLLRGKTWDGLPTPIESRAGQASGL